MLDIDDTSLITYGYEISEGFGFTPASNLAYLQTHTLPAVFGMRPWPTGPRHGITVFWITGRHESQRTLTQANLSAVGYTSPVDTAAPVPQAGRQPAGLPDLRADLHDDPVQVD